MTDWVVGLQRVARLTKVPPPTVRYWAETQGGLLGIRRGPEDEWRFSPQAVAFLHRVARGHSSVQVKPPATDEVAALRHAVRELAMQVADLEEETKQTQRLLSQLVDGLSPRPGPGPRPRVVRPWQPRRL